MPEITKETKDMKEEMVTKKETKASGKTTKKNNSSTEKTTVSSKKNSAKKVSDKTKTDKNTKTTTKKVASTKSKTDSKKIEKTNLENTNKKVSKSKNTSKTDEVKIPQKTNKKIEDKKPNNKKKTDEKIKEETVIQKIKNFIAKIVAMQEEARIEAEAKNEKVEEKKNASTKKEPLQSATPYMLEYYDLPYRYNETVVKILAQTPKRLFVYWDISDNDRQKYLKAFGERFFEETYPVLLVHNEEKDYTFEVAINDFANSWYLDIDDPKSKYVIELGRKFKSKPEIVNITITEETKDVILQNDYIPITISNVLEVPNNRILFETIQEKVLYRNVKNNEETFVNIENKLLTENNKQVYSIYDIYKEFYKDEIKDENMLDLLNPSSMSSSTFK